VKVNGWLTVYFGFSASFAKPTLRLTSKANLVLNSLPCLHVQPAVQRLIFDRVADEMP
jgi:hypothetical protein